ncbi:MAG: GDSL-type esterase/lipase family protein [Alphaproteobacteria bacterium]
MAAAPVAIASSKEACPVPEYLNATYGRLPRVTLEVKRERRLDILVVGTGSSLLAGARGPATSYPARLEVALTDRLPGVAVAVRTDVQPRRTAAAMQEALGKALLDAKPRLVIWQTGTVDAMRGVDLDDFRNTLDQGLAAIAKAGADAVLMNMQYSPRTESMIATGPYVDMMRYVAQHLDVPLFDRLAIMRHWSETGVFDFTSQDKSQIAERVHDCLGRLLADLVIQTAGLKPETRPDTR